MGALLKLRMRSQDDDTKAKYTFLFAVFLRCCFKKSMAAQLFWKSRRTGYCRHACETMRIITTRRIIPYLSIHKSQLYCVLIAKRFLDIKVVTRGILEIFLPRRMVSWLPVSEECTNHDLLIEEVIPPQGILEIVTFPSLCAVTTGFPGRLRGEQGVVKIRSSEIYRGANFRWRNIACKDHPKRMRLG